MGASGSVFFCLFLREAAPLVSETIQSGVSSSVPTMMRTGSSETGAAGGLRLRRGVWRSSAMGFTSYSIEKRGEPRQCIRRHPLSYCILPLGARFFCARVTRTRPDA